ncbi:MAG: hypothetical protein K9W44_16780 [Candidatus Lokiarchaeota archaeon]|nr:hypothetical protein [Candidatus Harpocratesius repetitus]
MFKKKGTKKIKKIENINLVLAALGVMEDETLRSVPADDIAFCLQIDFKKKMKDLQVLEILKNAQSEGYCEYASKGWKLNPKGEQLADETLAILSEE